jgi:plasmid replication initiation protein
MKNINKNIFKNIQDNLEELSWDCEDCKEMKNCENKDISEFGNKYCLAIIEAAILGIKDFKIPFPL